MIKLERLGKLDARLIIEGEVIENNIKIPSGLNNLYVYIDSFGGDAIEGLRLHTKIKECDAKNKIAEVAMSMSAATLPMVACDVIKMGPGALVMIHGVSNITQINRGNAEEIIKELNFLDNEYARCYAAASTTPVSEFKKIMLRDTFLDDDEMRQLGFKVVDGHATTHLPTDIKTNNKMAADSNIYKLKMELARRYGL